MSPNDREKLDNRLLNIRSELMQLLAGLTPEQWETPVYTDPETWTVSDTVRHLCQAEKSMVRLMGGIRQGHPGTPEDFDLNSFNRKGIALVKERTPADLQSDLGDTREKTIQFMDSLAEDDWDKKGRHAIGQVLSIFEICRVIAIHEKGHLVDMRQALNLV